MKEVHAEGYDFGRGWWIESSHVALVAPRRMDLRAIPIAGTPPTNGHLTASVIVAPMSAPKVFADWKGKLAGKIVLVTWPGPRRTRRGRRFSA